MSKALLYGGHNGSFLGSFNFACNREGNPTLVLAHICAILGTCRTTAITVAMADLEIFFDRFDLVRLKVNSAFIVNKAKG